MDNLIQKLAETPVKVRVIINLFTIAFPLITVTAGMAYRYDKNNNENFQQINFSMLKIRDAIETNDKLTMQKIESLEQIGELNEKRIYRIENSIYADKQK